MTMIGRRVGVLFQLPLQSRLLRANPLPAHQHRLPIRTLPCQLRRGYATPGRPRKAVGEPSRPVKRAVKRTSSAATSASDSPAKQKTDARKRTAAQKKPAKAPKKVLTEEQKAVKAARADKLKMTELRKAALAPPPAGSGASSAYIEFTKARSHRLKERKADDESKDHKQLLAEHAREVASEWRNATPAEVEHYNHLAHTHREAKQAEYKRWVESHSVEEIRIANLARATLRRKSQLEKGHRTKWPAIQDERHVKRPMTAYFHFLTNRQASGDFQNIAIIERTKLIAQEWKALSEGEKAKYKALQETEMQRYHDEYQTVYGHSPPQQQQQQTAAAAA
ncbi:hypothetical protein KC354_g17620 [Hortaea werneckii]|nr:hypothetical protein KC354_g17620 [Hortaea werneckii]